MVSMLEDYIFQFYEISITQSYKFNCKDNDNFQLIGMMKKRNNPLGAKNNDSRPCMDASAILESVDFRAFAVNVKMIAPTQKLYQSGHAIWWYVAPTIVNTFLEQHDLREKKVITLATSGGSGMGNTNKELAPSCPGAELKEGKVFSADTGEDVLRRWAEGMVLA